MSSEFDEDSESEDLEMEVADDFWFALSKHSLVDIVKQLQEQVQLLMDRNEGLGDKKDRRDNEVLLEKIDSRIASSETNSGILSMKDEMKTMWQAMDTLRKDNHRLRQEGYRSDYEKQESENKKETSEYEKKKDEYEKKEGEEQNVKKQESVSPEALLPVFNAVASSNDNSNHLRDCLLETKEMMVQLQLKMNRDYEALNQQMSVLSKQEGKSGLSKADMEKQQKDIRMVEKKTKLLIKSANAAVLNEVNKLNKQMEKSVLESKQSDETQSMVDDAILKVQKELENTNGVVKSSKKNMEEWTMKFTEFQAKYELELSQSLEGKEKLEFCMDRLDALNMKVEETMEADKKTMEFAADVRKHVNTSIASVEKQIQSKCTNMTNELILPLQRDAKKQFASIDLFKKQMNTFQLITESDLVKIEKFRKDTMKAIELANAGIQDGKQATIAQQKLYGEKIQNVVIDVETNTNALKEEIEQQITDIKHENQQQGGHILELQNYAKQIEKTSVDGLKTCSDDRAIGEQKLHEAIMHAENEVQALKELTTSLNAYITARGEDSIQALATSAESKQAVDTAIENMANTLTTFENKQSTLSNHYSILQDELRDKLQQCQTDLHDQVHQEALRTEALYGSFLEKQEKFARLIANSSIQNMSISDMKKQLELMSQKYVDECLSVERQVIANKTTEKGKATPSIFSERLQRSIVKDCTFVAEIIIARAEADTLRSDMVKDSTVSTPASGMNPSPFVDAQKTIINAQNQMCIDWLQYMNKRVHDKSSEIHDQETLGKRTKFLAAIRATLENAIERRSLPYGMYFTQHDAPLGKDELFCDTNPGVVGSKTTGPLSRGQLLKSMPNTDSLGALTPGSSGGMRPIRFPNGAPHVYRGGFRIPKQSDEVMQLPRQIASANIETKHRPMQSTVHIPALKSNNSAEEEGNSFGFRPNTCQGRVLGKESLEHVVGPNRKAVDKK